MVLNALKNNVTHSVDTDVLVLARHISLVCHILGNCLDCYWNDATVSREKTTRFHLLGFYDFTVFDSNPGFTGKARKLAMKNWITFKDVTTAFSFI